MRRLKAALLLTPRDGCTTRTVQGCMRPRNLVSGAPRQQQDAQLSGGPLDAPNNHALLAGRPLQRQLGIQREDYAWANNVDASGNYGSARGAYGQVENAHRAVERKLDARGVRIRPAWPCAYPDRRGSTLPLMGGAEDRQS